MTGDASGLGGLHPRSGSNARAAAVCAVGAAIFGAALVYAFQTAPLTEDHQGIKWLDLFGLLAGLSAAGAIFFAATWAVLIAPSILRPVWQVIILAAITAGLVAVYAWEADTLPPVSDLTEDYWPLAPIAAAVALPFGFWLHPALPFRSFLLAALLIFMLTAPDHFGVYERFTGETRSTATGTVFYTDTLFSNADEIAARRASGIQVTWYLLCTGSAWGGLGLGALLRSRRGRPPAPLAS